MTATVNPKIARALVHEADIRFQRYCHQTLREVVQDLTLRNVLRTPDPSDDHLLRVIGTTGVFRMSAKPGMLEMQQALERYAEGTLGRCLECGHVIALHDLERNLATTLCARCRSGRP